MCCPCAIQIRPFGLPYGLFFTTQGPESRRLGLCTETFLVAHNTELRGLT